MTRFAIVGAGWRTEFFLRIAKALPDRFEVTKVLVRSDEKAQAMEAWGVRTGRTLDDLLADRPQFVVTSVPWGPNPGLLRELAERGMPALSETPPAPDLPGLVALTDLVKSGAPIQVAEQYAFQPEHAARLGVVAKGWLGDVFQAQVSAAHGYHGVSLIRRFLGIGFEDATIRASKFKGSVVKSPDRNGPPKVDGIEEEGQTIATLDFDGRFGVFDFVGTQYFSWIRSQRVMLRGTRGELNGYDLRFLRDFQTPAYGRLERVDTGHGGNLEGHAHRGIQAVGEWIYRNPFPEARLADDEIAIATALMGMGEFTQGGPPPYPLAEACQDHYLAMTIDEAARTGESIRTQRQPWS